MGITPDRWSASPRSELRRINQVSPTVRRWGQKGNNRSALESYTRVSLREEEAVRGKVRHGTGECGWRPWRRGRTPNETLAAGSSRPPYRTSETRPPPEPPYETPALGGAFVLAHQTDKAITGSPYQTFFAVPLGTPNPQRPVLYGKAGRAPSRPGGVLARARYALQSTRGTWTSVILRKALQNLSPPNLPFGEIATAPQNGFPYRTDLQGRGRIWNLPGDEAPSPACCGDSDTLDVWPEPPFST
ncbi:hypothetical protein G5714_024655 [Onychostoma macrolepis]|uniref:Uncharacterized protein n=1 Tax=Onychostoma macrolepis TaxID=369639 RepID=A0A7J6BI55_9TELE|nr:hypothetical protein G5714_024655 [Onychostoma macrolepis]